MAFKAGEPKKGGRTKGTPNKRNAQLFELALENDADPFTFLINILKADMAALNTKETIGIDMRIVAAKELMPYLYGKRKPVDSDGNDGNDVLAAILGEISGQ